MIAFLTIVFLAALLALVAGGVLLDLASEPSRTPDEARAEAPDTGGGEPARVMACEDDRFWRDWWIYAD